jgi:hypothetical protein
LSFVTAQRDRAHAEHLRTRFSYCFAAAVHSRTSATPNKNCPRIGTISTALGTAGGVWPEPYVQWNFAHIRCSWLVALVPPGRTPHIGASLLTVALRVWLGMPRSGPPVVLWAQNEYSPVHFQRWARGESPPDGRLHPLRRYQPARPAPTGRARNTVESASGTLEFRRCLNSPTPQSACRRMCSRT